MIEDETVVGGTNRGRASGLRFEPVGRADSNAFALAETLRAAGIPADLPTGGAIGKRLKKADRAGIRYAVIIGGDELTGGTVQLRDLGAGVQEEVAHEALAAVLAAKLAEEAV